MTKLPFKETISMHLVSFLIFGVLFIALWNSSTSNSIRIVWIYSSPAILGYSGTFIYLLRNTQFHSNKPIMWINKE